MSFHLWACPTSPGHGHADGRRLLEEMYTALEGAPMPPIHLAPRGKPYFEDSPWHFSISHTGKLVFCLMARTPVGLDAEDLSRKVSPRLGEKILSAEEKALWEARDRDPQLLLTLWTLKEAAVKFTGDGLRGYPSNLSFQPDVPALRGSELHFSGLIWEGHRISICAGCPIPTIFPKIRHFSR